MGGIQHWRRWFRFVTDEDENEAILPVLPSFDADPTEKLAGGFYRRSDLGATQQIRYSPDGSTLLTLATHDDPQIMADIRRIQTLRAP